jgi:hypothetical protein
VIGTELAIVMAALAPKGDRVQGDRATADVLAAAHRVVYAGPRPESLIVTA